MLFKKEETKIIIVSCLIFLLVKVISNIKMPLPDSAAALITVIVIWIMNSGQIMSWIKVMAIIPAIILITLELIIKAPPSIPVDIVAVFVAILAIWTLFLYSYRRMEIYWERCAPGKPRVYRMKKALYVGSSIVLVVTLIIAFFL